MLRQIKENSNGHWKINGLKLRFLYIDINKTCKHKQITAVNIPMNTFLLECVLHKESASR